MRDKLDENREVKKDDDGNVIKDGWNSYGMDPIKSIIKNTLKYYSFFKSSSFISCVYIVPEVFLLNEWWFASILTEYDILSISFNYSDI